MSAVWALIGLGVGVALTVWFLGHFDIRRKGLPQTTGGMIPARPVPSPEVIQQRRAETGERVGKAYPHLTEADRGQAIQQIEAEAKKLLGRTR